MPVVLLLPAISDGHILSDSTVYATARAGTGTLTVDDTGIVYNVGQRFSTPTYSVWEGFSRFDPSAIPGLGAVIGVDVLVGQVTDSSVTNFVLEARTHDWGTTLTTADWVAGADLGGKDLLGSANTSASTLTGGVRVLAGTAALATLINAAAPFGILLCSDRHRAGTTPTTLEFLGLRAADDSFGTVRTRIQVRSVPGIVDAIGSANSKTAATTTVITTTTAVAAGDSIIVALGIDPAAGTISCADSAGNTYTLDEDRTNGSTTSGVRVAILASHTGNALAAGGTITVTHPSVGAHTASAASARFNGGGVKLTTAGSTGTGTAPSTALNSGVIAPLMVAACAVEGPTGDTYADNWLPFEYVGTVVTGQNFTRDGTTGGSANTNIAINASMPNVLDAGDFNHVPILGTSRLYADALVCYASRYSRLPLFREEIGLRTNADNDLPATAYAGLTLDLVTGYATGGYVIHNSTGTNVDFTVTLGGTAYGGSYGHGSNTFSLPASTLAVTIASDGEPSFTPALQAAFKT